MENPVREHGHSRDDGSAMIITLLVLAVLTALATTVASVTVNNLGSSVKAQQAGAALNAADAGVAQAMEQLQLGGIGRLKCSPTCTSNAWGNKAAPASASIPGIAGQAYTAWVEPVAPYPANEPGLYRIHSVGMANGSARRVVDVDVQVTRTKVPLGIFARTIDGGGTVDIKNQSVFSTGCVYSRSKLTMSGIDPAYDIPAGVHTSQIITDSQGNGQFCPETNKPIHSTTVKCDPLYPNDQDRNGGSLLGTACASTQTSYPAFYAPADFDGDGNKDVEGSFLRSDATLMKLFNFLQPALSPAQLQRFRAQAKSQGNYWTSSTGWTSPDERQAVMYFDLTKTDLGGTVDLNDIVGFGRAAGLSANDPACDDRTLTIVIEGGNAKLNSNQKLTASLFLTAAAPNGKLFKANGTSDYIGTIYADRADLTGNANLSMDECFLSNPGSDKVQLTQTYYRELDR
jgi:type II secretory pathway pseudopilin PulG